MALTDNLTHYYKFDESSGNAADSVGSITMTNTNTVGYISAKINNGADTGSTNTNKRFTGSNHFTQAEITGNWSIGYWIFYNALPTAGNTIRPIEEIAAVSGSSKKAFWLDRYTNTAGQYIQIVNVGTTVDTYYSGISVSTTTWYYHLWTYDGTSIRLYINGTTTADWTQTMSFTTRGDGSGNDTSSFFAGGSGDESASMTFDEMGFWTRTLTGEEGATLYNGGAGLQYPFSSGTVAVHPQLLTLGVG